MYCGGEGKCVIFILNIDWSHRERRRRSLSLREFKDKCVDSSTALKLLVTVAVIGILWLLKPIVDFSAMIAQGQWQLDTKITAWGVLSILLVAACLVSAVIVGRVYAKAEPDDEKRIRELTKLILTVLTQLMLAVTISRVDEMLRQ